MKKREITNNDLEQLFDRIIEQRPLINEDQVNSILQQLPVAKSGNAVKKFFQNHLNTLIVGVLVLGIAVTLLWVYSRPETEKTMVQNNQPKDNKVDLVPTDTLAVQPSVSIAEDRVQESIRVDNSLKTSTTQASAVHIQANTFRSVSDIYKHFDQQPQLFSIEPDRDTMIICKDGTSIKIKANSFVSEKTGNEIAGKVLLGVKEYYTISDMLLSKLTTISGDEILETGGMLYITATANQEKCLIRQGREIEIGFPYSNKKEDMALFNGEWKNDVIDWTPANTVVDIAITTAIVTGQEEDAPYTIVEQMPEFPGGDIALRKYMEQNTHYPFSVLKDKINGKVFISFIVEKDGTTSNIRVRRSLDSTLDKVAVFVISNLPKWIPAKQNGKAVRCSYTIPVSFVPKDGELTNEEILQSKAFEEKIKDVKVIYLDKNELSNQEFKEEFETQVNNDNFQKTTVSDVNRYVFSVSQLGWINCDRFINDKRNRTDYSILIDQPGEAIAHVIFHRFKSILPGFVEANRISFRNVPLGEKITIVAFKTVNDIIYLAVKETVVTDKEEAGLDFQPVTMELLKKEMEKLNKFN